MTPEEKAVIEAALYLRYCIDAKTAGEPPRIGRLLDFVDALIFACPKCNAGGHTCPGDGNPIGHTQTDCGQHSADPLPGESEPPKHAGADGSCPDYGNTLDPCPPGCALGRCVANDCRCSRTKRVFCHAENCHGGADVQEWSPATLVQCLAGDRIRIGTDETDVIRTDGGRVWHADNTDPYRPKPWKHIELRMELAANPGFQEYPPNTPCEILATPERKAVLLLQSSFPGSAVASSDVD